VQTATPIGIAVVEHRGRYAVGVRGANGPLPGYAEFPGGKCERGETPETCACRECLEETGLDVTSVELLLARTYEYPHSMVDLNFWLCRPTHPHGANQLQSGFRWVPRAELAALPFPEANRPVLEILSRRTGT
jgi:8-oxo-dGTP diphosphatase